MQRDTNDVTTLDEALISRLASMSGSSQRWLKTALQAISLIDDTAEDVPASPTVEHPSRETPSAPDLEDVLSGKATLSEQLERYPDLAEELEGLSDIVDLLRDAGERRRSRGEQILREEILGEEPESDGRPEDDESI